MTPERTPERTPARTATPPRRVPVVVVHEAGLLRATVDELRAAGWAVADGFPTTRAGARELAGRVRAGVVTDARSAADALLAALRGSGLVVHLAAARDVAERFVDDLLRMGPVEHRTGTGADLSDADARLLDLLRSGSTVEAAALVLYLSRRTAHRRLAALRDRFGVPTTAQLLRRAPGPDAGGGGPGS